MSRSRDGVWESGSDDDDNASSGGNAQETSRSRGLSKASDRETQRRTETDRQTHTEMRIAHHSIQWVERTVR